jgi:uncharacterized protein (UPF0332 family)
MNEDKRGLILYRLQQAEESLADARLLLNQGGSIRGIINRAYYGMFYSVLALLIDMGRGSAKHSGVITIFDQYLVKSGKFPTEMSKAIHKAFDLRQMGDYREFVDLGKEDAEETITNAEKFLLEKLTDTLSSIMVNKDSLKQTEIGSMYEARALGYSIYTQAENLEELKSARIEEHN